MQMQQNQTPQNDDKNIAKFETARFRLPPLLQLFLSLLQVVGIVLIVALYPNNILLGIFIFGAALIVKLIFSEARKYLANAKSRKVIENYQERMVGSMPIIQYHVNAYHYKRVKTKNGNTQKKKVITFRKTQQLPIINAQDNSENLAILMANSTCVRMQSNFTWMSGNDLTQQKWDYMVSYLRKEAEEKDEHVEGFDKSQIQGFQQQILAFTQGIPCYLQQFTMYFCYFIGLSIIYDTLFYSATAECKFEIQKTVFYGITNQNNGFPNNQAIPILNNNNSNNVNMVQNNKQFGQQQQENFPQQQQFQMQNPIIQQQQQRQQFQPQQYNQQYQQQPNIYNQNQNFQQQQPYYHNQPQQPAQPYPNYNQNQSQQPLQNYQQDKDVAQPPPIQEN
ncbi:hypothetical protein PPERSA_11199 [Pseudocohnilembus persalinus]|uniref:Transmembrane protein n=1 Tax=Pseudocohnilembus persalinus TaxID=266149 RepID=A0A0V0QZF2_PSEPJ|nr:hypothetical protein PPERSA_11199 [Pseudocohnilembus persalinus]|eukprot:KRX07650.1 hypothetical protein PPERSA_11199 [Pseudocohnilembus persalinus]